MMVLPATTLRLARLSKPAILWRIFIRPIVIGRNNLPLVNEGEALFHVAEVSSLDEAEKTLDAISDEVDNAMPAALRDEYGVV